MAGVDFCFRRCLHETSGGPGKWVDLPMVLAREVRLMAQELTCSGSMIGRMNEMEMLLQSPGPEHESVPSLYVARMIGNIVCFDSHVRSTENPSL